MDQLVLREIESQLSMDADLLLRMHGDRSLDRCCSVRCHTACSSAGLRNHAFDCPSHRLPWPSTTTSGCTEAWGVAPRPRSIAVAMVPGPA
jgi:hypothetical protein